MAIVAPTPAPTIPTPVPTTADPTNFDARADATLAALPAAVAGVNNLATNVFNNATETKTTAQTVADNLPAINNAVAAGQYISDNSAAINAAPGAATAAAGSATAAANSAAQAGNTLNGTSTTSQTVGLGSKTFTTNLNKAWQVGSYLTIARTSDPSATNMSGTVTAYTASTGAMTLLADQITGTGTFTDWTITQSVKGNKVNTVNPVISGDITINGIVVNTSSQFIDVAAPPILSPGMFYKVRTAGPCTLKLPSAPVLDDAFIFNVVSGRTDGILDLNGNSLLGKGGTSLIDTPNKTIALMFIGGSTGFITL